MAKKKLTKKPRAPKPAMKQKQRQSVNVKINIDNSKKTTRARNSATGPRPPSRQIIDTFPIFRDIPPPPPFYPTMNVAQHAPVAQIPVLPPPAHFGIAAGPPEIIPRMYHRRDGYGSDASSITQNSSLNSISDLSTIPSSIRRPRRTPARRIVIGSGNTSSASATTRALRNSPMSMLSGYESGQESRVSARSKASTIKSGNTPLIAREPITPGFISTAESRRADRERTGTPAPLTLAQLRAQKGPLRSPPIIREYVYPIDEIPPSSPPIKRERKPSGIPAPRQKKLGPG